MIELAGCVIRNSAGEILLLHRDKKGLRQWELPGGKLEEGENAESAAVREIKEELGVDVAISARLGDASFEERGTVCRYAWYEAALVDLTATPTICEPQTFDDLQYWDILSLRARTDLSANLRNLLKSNALAENPSSL